MDRIERYRERHFSDEGRREDKDPDVQFRDIIELQETRFKSLVQNIQEYIYSVDYTSGNFSSTYHSDKSLDVTGYTPEEYRRNPDLWFSMIHEEDRGRVNDFLNGIISEGGSKTIEHRIIRKDGRTRWVSNTCSAVIDDNGQMTHLNGFVLDVTKRKESEMRMQLAVRVLEVLNRTAGMKEVIREIVALVKNYLGLEAVGLRLMKGSDYTYDVTMGFPEYFVEAENSLHRCDPQGNLACDGCGTPALDCLCGMVIKNGAHPDTAYFTPRGSFWTNNSSSAELTASLSGLNAHMRNRCISEGYESVALIPLKSEDQTIGLFQMNDRRKGLFTPETIEFFEGIGASIGIALMRKISEQALLESEEKLRQRNNEMEKDLRLAQLVQGKFLANRTTSSEQVGVECRYLPHGAVGGDYFSITPLQEGGMGIFVGDVVGHGISAALFLSLLKAATDRVCRMHGMRPREYLRLLNNELIEYLDFNFVTGIYGYFLFNGDPDGTKFIFSNGGHPKPVLFQGRENRADFLDASGTILGVFPDLDFEEKAVTLKRGDRLFLYTDGIPEAKNESGQIVGFDELRNIIQLSYRPSMGEMLDSILEQVNAHSGANTADDDIVLIGFEIL